MNFIYKILLYNSTLLYVTIKMLKNLIYSQIPSLRQVRIITLANKNMKFQATTVVIVLILATGRDAAALPAVDHCLSKFEESLKETMALKKNCEEANLKDCCQVRAITLA